MPSLAENVRFSLRLLRRRPVFVLCVVLTFAFAVGANTTVFSVINAVWLRPTVPQPDRVGVVNMQWAKTDPVRSDLLNVRFTRLIANAPGLTEVAAEVIGEGIVGDARPRAVLGTDGRTLDATAVSHNFFRTLGVPVAGRGFLPEDDLPGVAPSVIISHSLWESAFSDEEGVIGRSILLSDRSVTIVGVTPGWFRGPIVGSQTDLWIPLGALPLFAPIPTELLPMTPVRVYGRLADGATAAEVGRHVSAALGRPAGFTTLAESAYPLRLQARAGQDRSVLVVLATTVVLVLVIGCLNLTSLLLARFEERRNEIGTRLALGAGRRQVLPLLISELLILAVFGLAGAMITSEWLLQMLGAFTLPSGTAIANLDLSLDWRVTVFSALLTVVATLATGVWPIVRVSGPQQLANVILQREPSRGGRGRARVLLLGSYVALSAVLLVAAGLFVRSVQRAVAADFGFASHETLFLLVQPRVNQYAGPGGALDHQRRAGDFSALLDRIQLLPGVLKVARGPSPLTDRATPPSVIRFVVHGHDQDLQAEGPAQVGAGYFSSLGVRLQAGRDFEKADTLSETGGAFIVSAGLARSLWPSGTAVGRRLTIGPWTNGEVVGVIPDLVRRGVRQRPSSSVYRAGALTPEVGILSVSVLTTIPPERVRPAAVKLAHELFPGATQLRAWTGQEEIQKQMASERLGAAMFSLFGATAATLCALGTFGLVSYVLARSRREWAIRLALGATPWRIIRAAVLRGIGPLIGGCVSGLLAAAVFTRVIESYLFDLNRLDPVSFGIAALVLLVPGSAAAFIAARALRRLDPGPELKEH